MLATCWIHPRLGVFLDPVANAHIAQSYHIGGTSSHGVRIFIQLLCYHSTRVRAGWLRYRVDCVGEYRELVTDHDEDVDIDMNVNGGYGCNVSFAIQLWEEKMKQGNRLETECDQFYMQASKKLKDVGGLRPVRGQKHPLKVQNHQ